MKNKANTERQSRTRTLIQLGGILQRSGLIEAFDIQTGENLQDYESRHKAAQLLGCLSDHFDTLDASEENLLSWQNVGERILKF